MNVQEIIKNIRSYKDNESPYPEEYIKKAKENLEKIHAYNIKIPYLTIDKMYFDKKDNPYGVSVADLCATFLKARNKYRERQLQFDIWKQESGYKRMNKKRWDQWFKQNLK